MNYKVLCTDGFSKSGLEELKKCSFLDVEFESSLSHEDLKKKIVDCDGLIVRSASHVSKDIIDAGKNLKVIVRAGVGIDNIDLEAATKKGVMVINAPSGNTTSAAELTMGMLLALARHIPQAAREMASGKWDKKSHKGSEIAHKTLGIIGLGRIGRVVARRAQSFKMNVVGYDNYVSEEQFKSMGIKPVSLEELYEVSDFITVHAPLNKETTNLIGTKEFKKMKSTVRIINCARGGIVNEKDLAKALKSGEIAGAALDVFTQEPFEENTFEALDNCIMTPHLGASTSEAQDAVAIEAASSMAQYFKDGISFNAVNLPVGGKDLQNYKQHIVLAEKVGSLATQLSSGDIEKITFSFSCGSVQIVMHSAVKGMLKTIAGDAATIVNAFEMAREKGIPVVEEAKSEIEDYTDAICVKITTKDGDTEVWGSVFSDGSMKIVRYNRHLVEIAPSGSILFIQNKDKPGVIGTVTTLLGENSVNIAGMQNVRAKKGENALTIIRIDGIVKDEVLKKIKSEKWIEEAKLINL